MSAHLPDVVAIRRPADHTRELDLFVPSALSLFAGHFPGQPILPGVAQVDWAACWGREFFSITGDFLALENLKLRAIVLPDTSISLALAWNTEKSQLDFAYTRLNAQGEKQAVSSGRFSFSGARA